MVRVYLSARSADIGYMSRSHHMPPLPAPTPLRIPSRALITFETKNSRPPAVSHEQTPCTNLVFRAEGVGYGAKVSLAADPLRKFRVDILGCSVWSLGLFQSR